MTQRNNLATTTNTDKGMVLHVLRSTLGECTNNGISSRYDRHEN